MEEPFEQAWSKYPRKLGKHHAQRHFKSQVKNQKDFVDLLKAIENYMSYLQAHCTEMRYVMHGKTFFNHNWQDWVDYQESEVSYVPESIREFVN